MAQMKEYMSDNHSVVRSAEQLVVPLALSVQKLVHQSVVQLVEKSDLSVAK